MRVNPGFFALLILSIGAGVAKADGPPSVISNGKRATALVEVSTRGRKSSGSAFCIDAAGFFITNRHVVGETLPAASSVKLVLNPGETNQTTLSASVIRTDQVNDLALLKVEDPKGCSPLGLGTTDGLLETQEVTAFGYPFGESLATASGDTPSVSVSTGHVTSLRKRGGQLYLIQLDASLNPGNSGGPVLDTHGKVIGIVQAGIRGASLNFAIPVSHLTQFLERPEIVFSPPPMTPATSGQLQDFNIHVVTFTGKSPILNVDLQFSQPNGSGNSKAGAGRHFTAKSMGNGLYTASAVAFPQPKSTHDLLLNAQFSSGSLNGRTRDVQISIAGRSLPLSQVRKIERGSPSSVTLLSGEQLTGAINGLGTMSVNFGELSAVLDMAKATSLEIEPVDSGSTSLQYSIFVTRDGRKIGEQTGSLSTTSPDSHAGPVATSTLSSVGAITHPTMLSGDKVILRLPAPVDSVVPAGGGRYLLLHLGKLRQIAVFDVSTAKIAKFIPVASDNVRVAGGLEKFFVALVDQNLLQRWDLKSFQRDLTLPIPEGGELDDMAMGYASNGPLLLMRRPGPQFINVATLKPLPITLGENTNWWHPHPQYPLQVRASADGSTFAAWEPGLSPSGIRLLSLRGNTAIGHYAHDTGGALLPSFDGELLFTGRGIFDSNLQPQGDAELRNMICMPTYQPQYFIGIRFAGQPGVPDASNSPSLSIFSTGDKRLLLQLPEPELGGVTRWPMNRNQGLQLDQRIQLMPASNLLVLIPPAADELILHHVNLGEALDKAGIDYLFVSSLPARTAVRGRYFSYRIEVKSKRGDVKFSLESGPPGMKLTPDGMLQWDVPRNSTDAQASIIISIKDASGQEIYHNFMLSILPPS